MVHINLLPVRQIKQKVAARQQLVTVFLSFLLLLTVLGVIGFFQVSKANQLQHDITQLNTEKQKHAKTLKLIKQLEKLIAAPTISRTTTHQKKEKKRGVWVQLLWGILGLMMIGLLVYLLSIIL